MTEYEPQNKESELLRMKIRAATISDSDILSTLATYAWMTSYGAEGMSRTMAAYITREFSAARYRSRVMQKGRMIWVIEHKSRLLGFCEVTLNSPRESTRATSGIEAFHIHRQEHDTELHSALFKHVMTELRKYRIASVWRAIWAKDHDALHWSSDTGFKECGEYFLEIDGEHLKHYLLEYHEDV